LHLVPLSIQAVAILEEIKPLTGNGRYVFPSSRGDGRPMSDGTIRTALKTLGYDSDVMTAHGFRTTASTLLNEQGWSADAIERQLCHMPRDQIRAAYNRAQYLGGTPTDDAKLGGLPGQPKEWRASNTY